MAINNVVVFAMGILTIVSGCVLLLLSLRSGERALLVFADRLVGLLFLVAGLGSFLMLFHVF